MADRSGDLLELFHDVLLTARLDDRERFRQVHTLSCTGTGLQSLACNQAGSISQTVSSASSRRSPVIRSGALPISGQMIMRSSNLAGLQTMYTKHVKLMAVTSVRQMVMETKSALESGIIGSGHSFAAARLDAQRGAAGWVQEQMSGLSYLDHIRQLAQRVEADWPAVQADLETIRCLPSRTCRMLVALSAANMVSLYAYADCQRLNSVRAVMFVCMAANTRLSSRWRTPLNASHAAAAVRKFSIDIAASMANGSAVDGRQLC